MSPISQRLDHPGIYANSTGDINLVASVILSYDEKDLDMVQNYNYNQDYMLTETPKFAFVKGPVWGFGEDDMQEQIVKFIKNLSFEVEELNLGDDFNEAANSHEIIMNGSIAKSLSKYYKTEKEKLHPFTISRIEAGIPVSAKQYIESIENAKKMQQTLSKLFNKFDAIITPAAPGQAPRDLMNTGNAIFNGYWTMMGVPAISLPLLKGKDSLPIGVQIITSWNEDFKLLKIAEYILQETKKLAD
jgi:Asp-tRNA(Asn)/Glu-tRNA(Gln) amidotransferase A subunit family amidase